MKRKLILLGTCLTLLCTACGKSAEEPSKDTSSITSDVQKETTTPEPSAANDGPEDKVTTDNGTTDDTAGTGGEEKASELLELGTKATVGTWKFDFKKAEVQNKILKGKYYQYKPSKGKKFICINASVKNQGKKKATFLPRMGYSNKIISARLYYGDSEYTATNLINYDKDILDKTIGPSKVQRGIITFEVPNKVAKKLNKLILKVGTDSDYVTYKLK